MEPISSILVKEVQRLYLWIFLLPKEEASRQRFEVGGVIQQIEDFELVPDPLLKLFFDL